MATTLSTRAIRPNAGIRDRYQKGMSALIKQMYRSVEYWLTADFHKREEEIIAQDASPAAFLGKRLGALTTYWEKKFKDYADREAARFSTAVNANTTNQLRVGLKAAGFSFPFKNTRLVNTMMRSIIAENVSLIRSIPQQFMTQVRTIVYEAVTNRRGLWDIADQLEKSYNVQHRRAELIGRDQTNKATEAIGRARCADIGIEYGIWMHRSGSKKPRETHLAMDGERFKLSEGLYDEAVGRNVHPGELIYCNCTYRLDLTSIAGKADENKGKVKKNA